MFVRRIHRVLMTWVAILALLAAAMVPTLAQALATEAADMSDVCTMSVTDAGHGHDADARPGLHGSAGLHATDCLFCCLQGSGPGLPPGVRADIRHPAALRFSWLAPLRSAPHARSVWVVRSRAPPVTTLA
jgi:hypothetical protein